MRRLTTIGPVLVLLALACGGSSDESPGADATTAREATAQPTARPTTAAGAATPTTQQAQQMLQNAMPTQAELPRFFVPDESGFSNNLQASQSQQFVSQAEALANFERNRRILSHSASFQSTQAIARADTSSGVLTYISYDLTLYADEDGAKAGYKFGTDHMTELKRGVSESLLQSQQSDVRVIDGIPGTFGDESFTIRVTSNATSEGQTFPVTYDVIGFRRGKTLGILLCGGLRNVSTGTVTTLVRLWITRIDATIS